LSDRTIKNVEVEKVNEPAREEAGRPLEAARTPREHREHTADLAAHGRSNPL
jgi:hypothetical protein